MFTLRALTHTMGILQLERTLLYLSLILSDLMNYITLTLKGHQTILNSLVRMVMVIELP